MILVPPSTVERYFSIHYAMNLAKRTTPSLKSSELQNNIKKPFGMDTCVARHHNGICMVCLSPRHPILTQRQTVTSVDYRVPMKEVRGKRKKGGIVTEAVTRLCTITCESGDVYTIQSGVKGIVIEYNDRLKDLPTLVTERPLREGYLGIVLPFPNQIKTATDHLVTKEEYDKLFQQHQQDQQKEEMGG